MEQFEQTQFKKGFNAGYIVQKHEPELSGSLYKTYISKSEYLLGLVSGIEQAERERNVNQELYSMRKASKDLDMDILL